MKWYFFYTQSYAFFKNKIVEKLKNTSFETVPLQIEELTLANPQEKGHHFTNITIKIELLIDCIKQNMNNSIVFTDATIFISHRVEEIYSHFKRRLFDQGHDMLFTWQPKFYNIGIIVLQCNDKVLRFWESCLSHMREKIELRENVHDQKVVNDMINNKIPPYICYLKICYLHETFFWVNSHLPKKIESQFYVFKMTVNLAHPTKSRYQQRIEALYSSNCISQEEYEREKDVLL